MCLTIRALLLIKESRDGAQDLVFLLEQHILDVFFEALGVVRHVLLGLFHVIHSILKVAHLVDHLLNLMSDVTHLALRVYLFIL